MFKNILKLVVLPLFILFLPGCVHQELVPPDQTKNLTDVEPKKEGSSVDISDLKTPVDSGMNSTPAPAATPVKKVEPKPHKTPPRVVKRIPFPSQEYAKLSKNGDATVKGSIYVISPTGQKIYGKNTRLYLNPVTSYSKQWYKASYLGGQKLSKADSRLYNYLKFTASNSKGKFAFYSIPEGSYYLIGIVKCKDECGYSTTRNIRIAKEIRVSAGETLNVNLSKKLY